MDAPNDAVRLKLVFGSWSKPELERAVFRFAPGHPERLLVRGRDADAYPAHNGFAWSAGLRAFCILSVQSCLSYIGRGDGHSSLTGGSRTPAAALDSSIAKHAAWLLDMFGTTARGEPIARRVLLRTNPERKRGGVVTVSLNSSILSGQAIAIHIAGEQISSADDFEKLVLLLAGPAVPMISSRHTEQRHRFRASSGIHTLDVANGDTTPDCSRSRNRLVLGVSFIPFYLGHVPKGIGPSPDCAGIVETPCGNVTCYHDGFAVMHVKKTFTIRSVVDFVMQRRTYHLDILAGRTQHLTILQGLQAKLSALRHVLPTEPAYVMTIHAVDRSLYDFSVRELNCMATPSLLGISDDPLEEPADIDDSTALPGGTELLHATVEAGSTLYIPTWENVIVAHQSEGKADVMTLSRLEVPLQHVWYKLHFLDGLLASQQLRTDASLATFRRLSASAHQDYLDLCRPDARGGSHYNTLRALLLQTSRIHELHETFLKRLSSERAA